MKKNIFKFGALFLMAAAFLTSCEEETVVYGGGDFVTLDEVSNSALTLNETAGTVLIPITLTRPQSTDITINYTLTSESAVAGVNYNVLTPSVVIPAGETTANLQLQIVDDEDFNLPRVLQFTLTGTSMEGLQVGIGDVGSYSKEITIGNDDFDCPTDFNFWLGALTLEDVGFATTPGTGSAGAECDILTVEGNLPGDDAAGNRIYKISFEPFGTDGSAGTVTVEPTLVRNIVSGGTTYQAMYEGDGTYDTSTGEIEIAYSVNAYLNGTSMGYFWQGTTIIKKAN